MWKHRRWMGIVLLLLLAVTIRIPAQAEDKKDRRTVRVGYYTAPGFQEYDDATGEYSGSSYEYLMAITQYADWDYEFVPVDFSEGVAMLEHGELDLMNNISKTEERLQTLDFSEYASGSNYGCLTVAADNTTYAYNDYDSFQDMKVGVQTGSVFLEYFNQFCVEHQISPEIVLFDNKDERVAALADGTIDAQLVSSSYQDGSRIVAKFAPMEYYFAVPKGNEAFLQELDDAMTAIRINMPDFENQLDERYNTRYTEQTVILSQEEKQYLSEHPTVTVAISNDWYPISYFIDEDTYAGPLADIYYEIGRATGITFDFVKCNGYEDALEAVASGKTDMIAECPYDFVFAAQHKLKLSNLVYEVGSYCVINERTYQGEIQNVAVFGNPYVQQQIRADYGDAVNYIECDDADEAVAAVLDGSADCTYVNQYRMSTYQNRGKYISLHYIQTPEYKYRFALGIGNGVDDRLQSIIGKGLQTFDEDYYSSLFQMAAEMSAVPDIEAQFYQNPLIFIVSLVALFTLICVVIMFLFYRKRMNTKNTELQRAKQAQSDFLSRMSHDMRTPMNGILGLSYLMEKEGNMQILKDYIPKLQESSNYLLQLINDVLDVNKIESGNLVLNPKPCDEEEVFNSIIELLQPLIDQKQIDFHFEKINIDWKYMLLDEQRVKQVFINLLNNAIKFTPEGGRVDFIMELVSETPEVIKDRFIIRDNGVGISEDFLPHIFEPFTQEAQNRIGNETGTGLGLSIVKQLVELMDGEISVKSKKGEGTEFTVYLHLPLTVRPAESEEDAADSTKGKMPKRADEQLLLPNMQVLLCEDHPLNATIAIKLLEQQGACVTWAKDGAEGVELAGKGRFDVILMDIRMPVMDGVEAAREIRKSNLQVPIIAMSANAYEEDVQKSLEAGMNAHLAKPIDPAQMYQTICKYAESNCTNCRKPSEKNGTP